MAAIVLMWAGRVARFVGYSALVLFALLTLGSLVPAIPVLGAIGPMLMFMIAPWIVILSVIGAVACFLRWRKTKRRGALVIAALAAFAVLGAGFIQAQQIAFAHANGVNISLLNTVWDDTPKEVSPPQSIDYGSDDGAPLPLAIYEPPHASEAAPAPILVVIHGGGFGGGSYLMRAADMRWFAARGYLVISVEYALSSQDRHRWDAVQPQLGCALNWVSANAARFGGDPSRVALWGDSAGGTLVLTVSYMANAGTLQPSCPGSPPHIAATVSMYPIIDVARLYHHDDFNAGVFARQMAATYTGGSPEQYPERYAAVSANTHVTPAAPPTLLVLAENDHLLPAAPAQQFAEAVRAAGVEARVIVFPYAEHAFDGPSGNIGNQFVRTMSVRFLAEHGLPPPEGE